MAGLSQWIDAGDGYQILLTKADAFTPTDNGGLKIRKYVDGVKRWQVCEVPEYLIEGDPIGLVRYVHEQLAAFRGSLEENGQANPDRVRL